MPTYEYQCESCGEEFEYFHGMNEAPKATCEKCGGALRKLLSAGSGLIFKGTGFYITDYKKSNSSPTTSEAKSDDKKPGGVSDSKEGAKTETPKTKTKSEPKKDS